MRRAAGLVLTVLALAVPALSIAAEDHPEGVPAIETSAVQAEFTPAFKQCLENPANFSTAAAIRCVNAEVKLQDDRLNAAYAKASADLNARQKGKLAAAERAWIAFRDADCTSQQDEDWGTISRIHAAYCRLDRTVQRTLDLREYPGGQER